jgi:hypothetical protein
MHATRELNRLDQVKSGLRLRISLRRVALSGQLARAARPLRWIDRIQGYWQRIGPVARLAAAPAGWWLLRRGLKQRGRIGTALRWAPAAWRIARAFGARVGV